MTHGKYIITGGTGFLGSLLGAQLLRDGYSVVFLGRNKDSRTYRDRQIEILRDIDSALPLEEASFFEVDFEKDGLGLGNAELAVIGNTQGLFHLAAELSFKTIHSERVRKANFENLQHVLALARSLKTTFFFVSTAYVHGQQQQGSLIPEELFPRPKRFHNAYEESKYDAEYFVKDWSTAHSEPYAILRPSIVIDREGRTSTQYGFSAFLIGVEKMKARFPRLLSGNYFPLLLPFPYSPRARLNLVPADWVIRAMIVIAEKNTINGKIFNLTNPEPVSIKRIIRHALREGSGVRFFTIPLPVWLVRTYTWLIHFAGLAVPPLRTITQRLWLFRFYMTEHVTYAMDNTQALVETTSRLHPTLSDDELRLVASHFISHYHKKRSKK